MLSTWVNWFGIVSSECPQTWPVTHEILSLVTQILAPQGQKSIWSRVARLWPDRPLPIICHRLLPHDLYILAWNFLVRLGWGNLRARPHLLISSPHRKLDWKRNGCPTLVGVHCCHRSIALNSIHDILCHHDLRGSKKGLWNSATILTEWAPFLDAANFDHWIQVGATGCYLHYNST